MHLSFQANLLGLISLDYRLPFAVLIGVALGNIDLCFILTELKKKGKKERQVSTQ